MHCTCTTPNLTPHPSPLPSTPPPLAVQALLPRPVAPPLCRRQVGGGARDEPAPHIIYTSTHTHTAHRLLNAHTSPRALYQSPIFPPRSAVSPLPPLSIPIWQVCYAKAVRAHARRGARRAEGGKGRERQPSGVAEGGAKREREEEAFAPAVRQHAERAVLVVSQLTTLASWGWPASSTLRRRSSAAQGPVGGCGAAVGSGRSRRFCAFPTPSCGRVSESADPSEGTTLLRKRRRRSRPQLQPRLRWRARLSSHRATAARRAARNGCGHSPRRRCRHRHRCVRRRVTSCIWLSEAGRYAECHFCWCYSTLPHPLPGLVSVAPDGAPHSGGAALQLRA